MHELEIAMEDEDMARGDDVTIHLVKKSEADEACREEKRRKQGNGVSFGTSMGEIHANSRKLRRCSKYFEILMSERWTSDTAMESSSLLQFYLELQTETLYYKDCFSRMNFSFPKQIPSVRHCIELLKVATQIQYQELVDVGMQYLSAVRWTADEEKQIRDFCTSGLFIADIASDLNARLDLPLTKEERQKKYLHLTKTTLKQHLQFALAGYDQWAYPITDAIGDALANSSLFEDAFYSIMSDSESGIYQSLQEYVMTLVKEEAEKLLITIKDPGSHNEMIVCECVYSFCWLHELSRRAKVSQVIVEPLLKIRKVNRVLMCAEHVVQCKWALKMLDIFKDLLAGHLFLNTSERSILVSDWIWMFKKEYLEDIGLGYLSELLTNIVLTFPLLVQQKIYNTWAESCTPRERILAQSYSTWLTHLTREAAKHEHNSEGADNSTDKM